MLVRQGLHFRRAVPARLRPVVGRGELWASLGTSSRVVARVRAGRLYAVAEEIFAVAADIVRLSPVDREAELRALEEASGEEQARTITLLERRGELQERLGLNRAGFAGGSNS